ncbi:MAG: hypothetical protein JST73_02665 [Actinobacteria bacterium]|nr:hypothetical protein [Actinomycetota bacterium]
MCSSTRSTPVKRGAPTRLIDEHRAQIVVSTQVLIELWAVCTRKLGLTTDAARRVTGAAGAFPVVTTDRNLVVAATELSTSHGYRMRGRGTTSRSPLREERHPT